MPEDCLCVHDNLFFFSSEEGEEEKEGVFDVLLK